MVDVRTTKTFYRSAVDATPECTKAAGNSHLPATENSPSTTPTATSKPPAHPNAEPRGEAPVTSGGQSSDGR